MPADMWSLYQQMLYCRLIEEAIAHLWRQGFISGEMHLGTGEEGVVVGVCSQLRDGDALALDHRPTAALLLRGVEPRGILREMLGRADGLSGGKGGHMHLYDRERLSASSGIVGASGPRAVGFGLAAQLLRPDSVAVAFFGEGAMNQGMMMEALNLAAVWELPVLFVCKDDDWAITTKSEAVTRGTLGQRVQGLGVRYRRVDGLDVEAVWREAGAALDELRSGGGPQFMHARCVHLEGHFLGFQLLRAVREPWSEIPGMAAPLVRSLLRWRGAGWGDRLAGLRTVTDRLLAALRSEGSDASDDPVLRARGRLMHGAERLLAVEQETADQVAQLAEAVLAEASE